MDFPRKAQELGKEAVEIAEVGLCFRWTEGENGHYLDRLGWAGYQKPHPPGTSLCRGAEPRRPAPPRQRTARTERLSGPQVSLETREPVRTGWGRPPAQLMGSQRLEPSSHLGSRFPSWATRGRTWRQHRAGVRNSLCHFLSE